MREPITPVRKKLFVSRNLRWSIRREEPAFTIAKAGIESIVSGVLLNSRHK
jgi:hypothetical protein